MVHAPILPRVNLDKNNCLGLVRCTAWIIRWYLIGEMPRWWLSFAPQYKSWKLRRLVFDDAILSLPVVGYGRVVAGFRCNQLTRNNKIFANQLISLFQNVQLEIGTMPTQKQQLRSPSYRRVRRSESSRVLAGRKVLALATPRRLARLDIRHFVCKVSSCDSLLPGRPCFANAKGGGRCPTQSGHAVALMSML